MEKIGVFVCHCGTNIAATVDVKGLADQAGDMPGVAFSCDYPYLCSEAGQKIVRDAIKEHNLTGIAIAACSPSMHEATFRAAAAEAGINPYMAEIANIREHCSWVHTNKDEATSKAESLTNAAVAKVHKNKPLTPGTSGVTKRALVIGGGIAGIQTALDIAEAGYKVDIVERTPSIGGVMAQLDKTFPTLDCAACILTPKMVDAARHKNIEIFTYSEVDEVSGFIGSFSVKIRKKARFVDEETCTGCGVCMEKCPIKKIPSEFDEALANRTAIYTPFAQAVPNIPVIDKNACIKLKAGGCGLCAKVCDLNAIEFEQEDKTVERDYGVIIVATGFSPMKPYKYGEYLYGESKDVLTSLEFERLMNAAGPTGGVLKRLSDGEKPRSVVFIQCVGSRGLDERSNPYCSKICCMYTAKHAMLIKEKYPDTDVTVLYIDVRTAGKNFDEFYRRAAENYGVKYIKGQAGKIVNADGVLRVAVYDMLENESITLEAGMVVLATSAEPKSDAKNLGKVLSASVDTNKFFTEAHPKLRPVESPTAGILLAGACQGPRDIPETVAQAGAAAIKALGILSKDEIVGNPCVSSSDETLCNGCGACVHMCPYQAISINDDRNTSAVNEAICQGCGACAVACTNGAMDIRGFSNLQILAGIEAICKP
ncbi:MAG: CoB--CoM heterodisulfide reductase iron-sulfur subunit A family protein [Defluviitaleaceae bacterium]|nr:CoB--CoM heterodisulfide reductase iron-sulfur subunit A family protein [Defluviitaleaceae bacterium]